MDIHFEKIVQFVEERKINLTVINQALARPKYTLASIKNIIVGGLYYLDKDYLFHKDKITSGLIITDADPESLDEQNVYFLHASPQALFYQLCQLVVPASKQGIHPTAIIDAGAKIDPSCYIGPYSVIGRAIIESNCVIDAHVVIGNDVTIGRGCTIEPNSYIGATGVAWIWGEQGQRIIQPQFGGVIIEEGCFIGSDVSIVRGSVNENTVIGKGTMIAHGSKIGHGSVLGEQCHLANNVSLAGNSKIGKKSFLGAACVVSSHASIAEGTVVGAGAVVTKSFQEAHIVLAGIPAKIIKEISRETKMNGVPKLSEKKTD